MQFSYDSLLAVNRTTTSSSSAIAASLSSSSSSISTWMPPIQGAHIFGAIFILCGIVALIFNATVMFTLCRFRRNLLSRVFYILIFNFAIIDLLKSICSVIWALKMLPVGIGTSIYFMKADQFALMILRFTNLATILNLLLLTLNEYFCIVYPFHYRRLVTNTKVILLIVGCWIVAWLFTLFILFLGSRKQSIFIKPGCLTKQQHFIHNVTTNAAETTATTITTSTITNNISFSLRDFLPSSCFVRNRHISNNTEFIYNISIIIFCFACLIISITCYSRLICVISKIIKQNSPMRLNNNYEINGSTNREFHHAKRQLLKKKKHVIVIGSVLAIDTVYLISYSAIKFLFVTRLKSSRLGISHTAMYYLRWAFQTLICLNALLQPLCYLRMHEFRNSFKIVMFGHNQSRSFSPQTTQLSVRNNWRRIIAGSSNRN